MSVSEALRTLATVPSYSLNYTELFRSPCCVGAALLPIVECVISYGHMVLVALDDSDQTSILIFSAVRYCTSFVTFVESTSA